MPNNRRAARAVLAVCFALLPSVAFAQTIAAGFTPGSFRTTETGAATYSIPIRVPPGIAGMEPKLALAYNSQGSNGLLGTGFGLGGLSAIHRCPKTISQDGEMGGIHYISHDRFCLDGQRLVSVNGTYGANGTEYRTERESFTKVVSYGGAEDDPSWFKIWTKAGQVMEYGNTAASRVEAQGKAQARVWALNKVSDTKGNYFAIAYAEDNGNGDFYPTRIDYTGNAGASVNPFASVRFTYESRSDTKPNYVGGSVIKTMNRLINVKTYVGETPVTDYRLAYDYSPDNGPSRVTSVKECSGDGTQCFNPTTFAWQNPAGAQTSSVAWSGMQNAHYAADVNGDGMADIVFVADPGGGNAVHVKYSSGAGFGGATYVAAVPVVGEDQSQYIVGDFDGNGRADMVFSNSTAALSTAGGFSSTGWPGMIGPWFLAAPPRAVDVNGDGKDDIVYESGGGLYVRYSTGGGFGGASLMASRPVLGTYGGECGCETVYAQHSIGDFNGDGRADVVFSNGTAVLSTPAGFVSSSWSGFARGRVVDVNADGRADVIEQVSCGSSCAALIVYLSTGVGFEAGSVLAYVPVDMNLGEPVDWQAGDFDGNGRSDIAFAGWPAPSALTPLSGSPDQVGTITTSLGAQISITYKPLTDGSVYAKDSDAGWPVRDLQLQGPLYVVSSSSASNGIGGNRVTNYFYRGAKAHLHGGGFLGFRQVEVTDVASGIKTVANSGQDYPYHGLPTQSQRKQPSGTVIGQADSTWTKTVLTPAAGSGGKYHKVELTQSVELGYELNNALITTVTTSTTYNAYGDVLTVTTGTGDGYSKVTTNTYESPDTANWILGRLATASVTANMPSPGVPITRTSGFKYDAASGLLTKEIVEPASSTLCLVTVYLYDAFGNKTSASTRNCDGSAGEAAAPTGDPVFASRTSTTSFAATTANPTPGQFPTSSANALTHTETKEFDARFGTVTKLTGPNTLATTWSHDLFGRKATETRADGTTTTWTYTACGTCPANGRYYVTVVSSGQPTASAYFDNLNREIRTESQGFDGTLVRKDTEYNSLGQVLRVSRPYYAGQTPQWTSFTYDLVGRVLTATEPNNAITTTVYSGLTVTTTNHLNQSETRVKNSQGQLVQVTRQ